MLMSKRSLYLLGLITLLVFPIPTFLAYYFIESKPPILALELDNINLINVGLGLAFGTVYALLALLLMQLRVFKTMPNRIEKIVQKMDLSIIDCVFLSICAGVGEEILFRAGVQLYLGPIITSVVFVGLHGYINPFDWKMSLYGLVVLPFIVVISYGLIYYGLWFCIAAHFIYDLVLFLVMSRKSNSKQFEDELFVEQEDMEE